MTHERPSPKPLVDRSKRCFVSSIAGEDPSGVLCSVRIIITNVVRGPGESASSQLDSFWLRHANAVKQQEARRRLFESG